MNAAGLKEIFVSPEFRQELGDLSSYLASIMQERPIVFLLAKCLWKIKKHAFTLERDDHCDLCVEQKKIEFKFTYDTCCTEKLEKELTNCGGELDGIRAVAAKKSNWSIIYKIWQDVCVKKPDIFVWIICERDVSKVPDSDIESICRGVLQKKHTHRYKSDRSFLAIADKFLKKLQAIRPFFVTTAEIETNGDFPSTYHFRICDFSTDK
jgi:hypothetical protein